MHLWLEIVARELAMLLTLLALGAGPASYLGRRFDPAARLAMAPVLGLCVGTCVFTTLIWLTAASNTYLLLPLIALLSLAVALRRRHRTATPRHLGARDAAALALVCVVVAAPLNYTLHQRGTVGPMGFQVWDSDGYTATADGMQQESIRQAVRPQPRGTNLGLLYWVRIARAEFNLDASPLEANLNGLMGLGATETQSLYMIVFLLAGALGAFASVRYVAPRPSWAAPLAGVLFAGPLFMQLIVDGSQAATCGIGLVLPIATIGTEVLRERRLASLALFALLASGLIALYPLIVPTVATVAVIVMLALGARGLVRGQLDRRGLVRTGWQLLLVLALTALLNLVSFTRDLRFWTAVLGGKYISSGGFPKPALPIATLPGWLLQSEEFYSLSNLAHAPASTLLIGAALPALFIALMLIGVLRHRQALILLLLVGVYAALAEYTNIRYHCSYCVDRNLLPVAPLAIGLMTLGVVALACSRRSWLRWGAVAAAAIVVVSVGSRMRSERVRFADSAYFLDSGSRTLLAHLPPHAGPVELEGYGEGGGVAPGELPLTYLLVSERNHGEVSLPTEHADYASTAYLGGRTVGNPVLSPGYRYVLTRFGGVQTGRRVLARAGPLALEERTGPLDALEISGFQAPFVRLSATGTPALVGAPSLLLVGQPADAWILLRFQTIAPAAAAPQPGVRSYSTPHELSVCLQPSGTPPLRTATLGLQGQLFKGVMPNEQFAVEEPAQGIQLVSMLAVTHCSPTGEG